MHLTFVPLLPSVQTKGPVPVPSSFAITLSSPWSSIRIHACSVMALQSLLLMLPTDTRSVEPSKLRAPSATPVCLLLESMFSGVPSQSFAVLSTTSSVAGSLFMCHTAT